jgi:peptidoglycan/LPS O-acetylase OafA/YrhL
MARNADLDGLRGVAIFMVLYCHGFWQASLPLAAQGWAGVDLFFVLSGYLITSILLKTRECERYFGPFYARRTRRIFPPFYAVLLLDLALSLGSGYHRGNVKLWLENGLFLTSVCMPTLWTQRALLLPMVFENLISLWSVSIEELFYLTWAPLVRWCRPRTLLIMCFAILLSGPWVRYKMHTRDLYEFSSLWGRLDGLVCGAMIAMLALKVRFETKRMRHLSTGLVLGLVPILCLLLYHRFDRLNPVFVVIGYPLMAFVSAAILLWLLARKQQRTPLQRMLRVPPLQWLGRRSYMLYLMNPMVVVAWQELLLPRFGGHLRQANFASGVLMLITTCIVAEISWRYMESPLLSRKKRTASPLRESATNLEQLAVGEVANEVAVSGQEVELRQLAQRTPAHVLKDAIGELAAKLVHGEEL